MEMNVKAPSPIRRAELRTKGYFVEDMELEYGEEFKGQFRWMNSVTSEFQDCDVSYSALAAWSLCDQHEQGRSAADTPV